ncbi:hypothetical protein [Actinoplanes sp. NPDC026670]|uniref:hypothetical protein n=1 Tax=Actinoplanes sp. NPDC026670 TaxID=3154700 RepID=UPI0033C3E029
MFPYQCPTCDTRGEVADAVRANARCSMCEARLTWDSLALSTQHSIDAAIRRGPIQGVLAMSELTPPIRMPYSLDLLAFREREGRP